MSESNTSKGDSRIDADEILHRIETFLLSKLTTEGEEKYYKTNRIAKNTNMKTKQVGAVINQLNEKSDRLSIEKWGRSKSTTWAVRREDPNTDN